MNIANVNQPKLRSPLSEAMRLSPRRSGSRAKKLVVTLVLTSLVDAFSIMLLYLVVQNSGLGSTLELKNAGRLPVASEATALHQGTLVRIVGAKTFLGDELVADHELASRLSAKRAQAAPAGSPDPALIVQADRDADFARLAKVIRAGSVSGFHTFKFAVLHEGGQP